MLVHIIYFFTYDYSFKLWSEFGTLERETEYFQKFYEINSNITFTFVTYGDSSDYRFRNLLPNINIIPIYDNIKFFDNKFLRFVYSFLIPFKLSSLINTSEVDVVKQNQLQGSWISIIYSKLINKPLIIRTGYDVYKFKLQENKPFYIKLFYKFLTKLSLNTSSVYTVTSEVDKNFLKNTFNHKKNNIKLRRNFIKLDSNLNYLNFNDRLNEVICVGRLEKQKNYDFIIDSLGNSNLKVNIYGSGSELFKLNILANSKSNKNFQFHGQIENSEILKLLKNYKFFVSSSLFEGNPKNILEAMACGCIVFAPDVENIREIITDGVDGFLYDFNSTNLDLLINEKSKDLNNLNIISKNAVKRVYEKNSLEFLVKKEKLDFESIINM